MPDFLLELRSEEIPARMQARARDDLARLFAAELAAAGLTPGEVTTYATPRRLALIARDLPAETKAVSEEVKGPRSSAPPQALEGFLRKTGLIREQLAERDGVLFAVVDKPGRPTADVLAQAIPNIVRAFPWPKSMRWGAASASTESLRWVRPLQGIVAILGEELVSVEIAGVASGYATVGHRFHHPGPITLGGAHDYVEKLRACHVIVDPDERAQIIRTRAAELAREAGLELIEDEGLVAENAGLTEWPVPLLGRFDEAFLEVPPEVIQLTARVNQKYFVCRVPPRNGEGDQPQAGGGAVATGAALANAFICTANIAATDGGAKIVEGNRKVLAARLADARFFYEQDLKVPLEEQARKLDKIVFHEKLGTIADKVDRVAKLARWLVEEGIVGGSTPSTAPVPQLVTPAKAGVASGERTPADHAIPASAGMTKEELAGLAERAARLCKADLVTGMVGEFPELQGLMGGYYAAAQGEHPAVAEAIRDHYKPVGQGDEVPTAPVTVAVSLADKLDSLMQFFRVGLVPTGSKDPFALRRSALGAISVMTENSARLRLYKLFYVEMLLPLMMHSGEFGARAGQIARETVDAIRQFVSAPSLAESAVYHIQRKQLEEQLKEQVPQVLERIRDLLDFFAERLKVQQREAGVRHDLIDAVFALGGEDDLVRLLARVRALQAFVGTEDGANLLAGYKRAANILKKEGYTASVRVERSRDTEQGAAADGFSTALEANGDFVLSYSPQPEETALRTALDSAEPRAAAAVEAEEFEGAMAALASLRAPIDAFFDKVTVNDPDPDKREARLNLLARVRDAVHRVADFSKIEG